MHTHDSSIATKAFGENTEAALIVNYESHRDALRFLSAALSQANGVALLQGPSGSGKTTIIKEQLDWSIRDAAVALLDGEGLTPRHMVMGMLTQFGVRAVSQSDEQLLQRLNQFLTHETRSGRPPLLIIDNADHASPGALRQLNGLAALDVGGHFALRIILTGKGRLTLLLRHDSMRSLARRHPAEYSLNPMTAQETMIYLRTRLIAAGGEHSEKVFPIDVCERLHEVSRGWPGLVNERAVKSLEKMTDLKPAKQAPRVIVTRDGKTIAEYELTERQCVIGRAEFADIIIEDSYVSKLHAMLKVYANAVMLFDLNSSNGTTVNSRVVQKAILRNGDIIVLGRHRLKIESAAAISPEVNELINVTDTMTMHSIDDLRRSRARRTIKSLKNKQPG